MDEKRKFSSLRLPQSFIEKGGRLLPEPNKVVTLQALDVRGRDITKMQPELISLMTEQLQDYSYTSKILINWYNSIKYLKYLAVNPNELDNRFDEYVTKMRLPKLGFDYISSDDSWDKLDSFLGQIPEFSSIKDKVQAYIDIVNRKTTISRDDAGHYTEAASLEDLSHDRFTIKATNRVNSSFVVWNHKSDMDLIDLEYLYNNNIIIKIAFAYCENGDEIDEYFDALYNYHKDDLNIHIQDPNHYSQYNAYYSYRYKIDQFSGSISDLENHFIRTSEKMNADDLEFVRGVLVTDRMADVYVTAGYGPTIHTSLEKSIPVVASKPVVKITNGMFVYGGNYMDAHEDVLSIARNYWKPIECQPLKFKFMKQIEESNVDVKFMSPLDMERLSNDHPELYSELLQNPTFKVIHEGTYHLNLCFSSKYGLYLLPNNDRNNNLINNAQTYNLGKVNILFTQPWVYYLNFDFNYPFNHYDLSTKTEYTHILKLKALESFEKTFSDSDIDVDTALSIVLNKEEFVSRIKHSVENNPRLDNKDIDKVIEYVYSDDLLNLNKRIPNDVATFLNQDPDLKNLVLAKNKTVDYIDGTAIDNINSLTEALFSDFDSVKENLTDSMKKGDIRSISSTIQGLQESYYRAVNDINSSVDQKDEVELAIARSRADITPEFKIYNSEPLLSIKLFVNKLRNSLHIKSIKSGLIKDLNFLTKLRDSLDLSFVDNISPATLVKWIGEIVGKTISMTFKAIANGIAITDDFLNLYENIRVMYTFNSIKIKDVPYYVKENPDTKVSDARYNVFIPDLMNHPIGDEYIDTTQFTSNEHMIVTKSNAMIPEVGLTQRVFKLSMTEDQYTTFYELQKVLNKTWGLSDHSKYISILNGSKLVCDPKLTPSEAIIMSITVFAQAKVASYAALATAKGLFTRLIAAAIAFATTIAVNAGVLIKKYSEYQDASKWYSSSLKPGYEPLQSYNELISGDVEDLKNFEVLSINSCLFIPYTSLRLSYQFAKFAAGLALGFAASAGIGLATGTISQNISNKIRSKKLLKKYMAENKATIALDKKGKPIKMTKQELKRKVAYDSFIQNSKVPGATQALKTSVGMGKLATSAAIGAALAAGKNIKDIFHNKFSKDDSSQPEFNTDDLKKRFSKIDRLLGD